MRILIAATEAVPYVKTGGLGDVAGTLALELAKARHEVALVLPLHQAIVPVKWKLEIAMDSLRVKMGDADLYCRVWARQALAHCRVYFIEYDRYFHRDPIYNDGSKDYYDNGSRFAFFSKACLDLAQALDFQPQVIQANDWQTALIPFYLKTWNYEGYFRKTASLLSIHNMGYQGHMPAEICSFMGIQRWQFRESEFESFGGVNFLKGGIFYADKISTVSPTYAKEILGEPGGSGLSPYLQRRSNDVAGILNGIDQKEWNPKKDKLLPARYSAEDLSGKAICKAELQKKFLLEEKADKPIFGLVGRLADQKGLDLLKEIIPEIMRWDLQMVLIGSGDPELERFFGDLPKHYPGKFGSYIGFEPKLAHLVEAGSDFFVMPSRYEPCGLNQMYSLIYGTLPVVRATGGLADTVENFQPQAGQGTGFVFQDISSAALRDTLGWALHTWYHQQDEIAAMRVRAMERDHSWKKAVKEYVKAYKEALVRRALWK